MTALEQAEAILRELMQSESASSCTLYVADPWWDGEYRLVLMPGVKITEPMHGLMLPLVSRRRVIGSQTYEFFENAASAKQLRDELTGPLSKFAASKPQIYGDFVMRENVASCARVRYRDELSLFVNFDAPHGDPRKLRMPIRAACEKLRKLATTLREELVAKPFPIADLLRALEPTRSLAAFWQRSTNLDLALREYLTLVLEAAMKALRVSEADGFGTIHLLRPESRELELFAQRGEFENEPKTQSLDDEFGIVSWVANKKRALLINDIQDENCVFAAIHENCKTSLRSELAVPMLVNDDEVLGVVNLECDRVEAFSPSDVRTLWYSANQAAVAVQLAHQVESQRRLSDRSSQLFDGMRGVISGEVQTIRPFDFMAKSLQEWAEADLADIWSARFDEAGATYDEFKPLKPPRQEGWSRRLVKLCKPIWIYDIDDVGKFSACYWDGKWKNCDGADWPTAMNEMLKRLDVHCELGLPIQLGGKCIGLAWIKYLKPCGRPSAERIKTLAGIAANIGLVMDWWDHYQLARKQEREFERSAEGFRKVLFPEPGTSKFRGVSAAALSCPHGEGQLGGDFYQFVSLNESDTRFGFVVGDIEGHGMPAALRMLPVLTTFRLFYQESNSTKYMVERLIKVASTLEIRATAMYAVIDMQTSPPLLFASSAGHPRLRVFRRNLTIPEFPGERAVRFPLGIEEVELFGEDVMQLEYGDLIVAYTDGITESGAPNDFGIRGVLSAVLNHFHDDPEAIATAIYEAAKAHGGGELNDDATVIIIRIDAKPPAATQP